MRAALLILALVPLATASAQTAPTGRPVAKTPTQCKPTAGLVDHRDGTASVRPLAEMPPAARVLTVYREVDGCPTPVVLRRGVGADIPAEPPTMSGQAEPGQPR